ncbi:hypothetical protein FHS18_000863 [Paenibacillus phyllosphaerae]|uniref:DUF4303 domain-containing protein n=1 Tax=Paenibacillus phyllosphaerae TaxID=274593 RepID=A0A7W5AV29_9BACL|nr:DUF4303 domain-containing protein [Paenibacillus phyllosphaerae]MBB3108811.1 hypothetical protein [Paenibacillus phyllosphaerae]
MNTYYAKLGRLIDERTSYHKDGYYILCEDNILRYSDTKPNNIEIITSERFVDALADGCRTTIANFAETAENKDVYAFNLFIFDDHKYYIIYMNTEEKYNARIAEYQAKYPRYAEPSDQRSVKYSQGDFDFEFFFTPEDVGDPGRIISAYEDVVNIESNNDEIGAIEEDDLPVIAFEVSIIHDGMYVLTLKAIERLLSENAFASLNRTSDFIAYAAINHDWLDYSLIMPKTIDSDLYKQVFPDVYELHNQFKDEMQRIKDLSVSDAIDYWMPAIQDRHNLESPFSYCKAEYDVFLQVEVYENELAQECIHRMKQLLLNDQVGYDYFNEYEFYAEALHYAGELSNVQKTSCIEIADALLSSGEEQLFDVANELLVHINRKR